MKINSKMILILSLIAILAIGLGGCAKKNVEGLVAEVDGVGITQEEFDSDYMVYKNQFESQLGEGALDQIGPDGVAYGIVLKDNIIEKLIMEKLIAKESGKLKLTVTDEEVAAQMSEYLDEMEGQEKFDAFLESIKLSREFFEANLRKELLFNKYKEATVNDVTVTEADSEAYFEANKEDLVVVRASHILVGDEAAGKAALERLKNGEVFADVALDVSLDGSAIQGGDLGYFPRRKMIAEFDEAAFALKVGETSGLVKTEVGYHIIQLVDRKDTFESLKGDIDLILKEVKYEEFIQKLRSSAKVEIYLDSEAK